MESQSLGYGESSGTEVADELEHVPLIRRRGILLGAQNLSMFGAVEQEQDEGCEELDILSLTPDCSSREVGIMEQGQSCKLEDPVEDHILGLSNIIGESSALGDSVQDGNCSHDVGTSNVSLSDSSPHIICKESDGNFSQLDGDGLCDSSKSGTSIMNIKEEVCDYTADDYLDHVVLKKRQRMLLSGKLLRSTEPVLEVGFKAFPRDPVQLAVKGNGRIDVSIKEPVAAKDDKNVPSWSTSFKIKDEFRDNNELDEEEVDHVCLGDRMKRQKSSDDSKPSMSKDTMKNSFPFEMKYSPIMSEPAKAFSVDRPRKRKKTATDSVETALEEDAPGLLQVLIDKGVLVDDIKLYGQTEIDEAIDESSIEDSFTELESVISKIFSQRQSFLKLAPIHFAKGSKATYCLGCLISLIEQTRYLRFRKWPAEWGWCRDLQSFIFVFERHNRIVLERPEYGFATYFFELEDSSPIDWQIKRLITAMKFTCCSRISLIENKAIMIGEDMTEGEAKVLIEYGWVPNSGLGTMLKYRDRVVHDRKFESDASEWRSKIGKLLMDGYNGGTVVWTDIQEKVAEYESSKNSQIKVEI